MVRRLEAALNEPSARIAGLGATREGEGPGVRKRARPRTRSSPLDCRVACLFHSWGYPLHLQDRVTGMARTVERPGGERSEPERTLNRDGGRIAEREPP